MPVSVNHCHSHTGTDLIYLFSSPIDARYPGSGDNHGQERHWSAIHESGGRSGGGLAGRRGPRGPSSAGRLVWRPGRPRSHRPSRARSPRAARARSPGAARARTGPSAPLLPRRPPQPVVPVRWPVVRAYSRHWGRSQLINSHSIRTCPASTAAPLAARADWDRQTHLYRITIVRPTLLRTMSSINPVQVMRIFLGGGSHQP